MSFPELRARVVDAVFARLGEDASWAGSPETVRVRRSEVDEDARFDQGALLVTTRFMRVRRSEVPNPAQGDLIQLVTGEYFKVTADPRISRNNVWTCEVSLLAS